MNHYETKSRPHHDSEKAGGGFPISGVVGRAEVMDAPNPGGVEAVLMQVARLRLQLRIAVIDAIEEENLCDRANELGAELVCYA
ncbi:hypothetical protein ABVN80_20680 [Acinetobacter baumannii]